MRTSMSSRSVWLLASLAWMSLSPSGVLAQAGSTTLVSVTPAGVPGNGDSRGPSISARGRFVAFWSGASDLVPNDTNSYPDVFVRDRVAGVTTRVNVSSTGDQSNGWVGSHGLSEDGRFVVFSSTASDLVPGDSNGTEDVFVHDRDTGMTTRVSVASDGTQGLGKSYAAVVTANGRFVAFASTAILAPDDTSPMVSVYVHDRRTHHTQLASINPSGTPFGSTGSCASLAFGPTLSANGRFVAFEGYAGSPLFCAYAYVRDLATQTTEVVGATGNDVDNESGNPVISPDGSRVVYLNDSLQLVMRELDTGTETPVCVSDTGILGSSVFQAAISSDNRFVALTSPSPLVADDTNGVFDSYVRDVLSGQTIRVSVSSAGLQSGKKSIPGPAISRDGRFVAFSSLGQFVSGDTNNKGDIFVHELRH